MSSASDSSSVSKGMFWTGWALSVLPSLLLVYSAIPKITLDAGAVKGFTDAGWSPAAIRPLGFTELLCTVIYLNPQTSVFGAILLTGYMGGTISHHLSHQESIIFQVCFGVVIWLGIFLREKRLWAILPWRT